MQWSFSSQLATIIAALVGATIGSLGSVVLSDRLAYFDRADQERQALIREHVFGIQEGAEQLSWRVHNAAKQKDRPTQEKYYRETTLYALGRSLASARILAIKGDYPRVMRECPALGEFLRGTQMGDILAAKGLRYYDRLALAEILIDQESNPLRVRSFIEFHERLASDNFPEKDLLAPAHQLVEVFKSETNEQILKTLCSLANASSACSSIPANLPPDVCEPISK